MNGMASPRVLFPSVLDKRYVLQQMLLKAINLDLELLVLVDMLP